MHRFSEFLVTIFVREKYSNRPIMRKCAKIEVLATFIAYTSTTAYDALACDAEIR